jgi:hypothetical protein
MGFPVFGAARAVRAACARDRPGLISYQIDIHHRGSRISRAIMSQPPKPDHFDNPHAPQVFADEVSGYWVNAGCVHITLDAGRVDHSADHCPVNRATVLRLTLPIPIAQVLAVSLYDFLKQRGLAPSPDHGH